MTALQPVDGIEGSRDPWTIGGAHILRDGRFSGWTVRGQNERNVIRRQAAEERLREFYRAAYDSWGMGV